MREGEAIYSVSGRPFYLDMTYNEKIASAPAYIGLDFGTSNTSISYVDQLSVQSYKKRASDRVMKSLNELVYSLPFPLATPLARYLGESNQANFVPLALDFIEASLSLAAYTSYLEYCAFERRSESKLFRGFNQRSSGPLWKLVKESLAQLGKKAVISAPWKELLTGDNYTIIDKAVTTMAQFKHKKIAESEIDHKKPVHIIANICQSVFSKSIFGFFDNVQPGRFGVGFTATFRHAIGNPPFSHLFQYKGNKFFSKEQAFLIHVKNPAPRAQGVKGQTTSTA